MFTFVNQRQWKCETTDKSAVQSNKKLDTSVIMNCDLKKTLNVLKNVTDSGTSATTRWQQRPLSHTTSAADSVKFQNSSTETSILSVFLCFFSIAAHCFRETAVSTKQSQTNTHSETHTTRHKSKQTEVVFCQEEANSWHRSESMGTLAQDLSNSPEMFVGISQVKKPWAAEWRWGFTRRNPAQAGILARENMWAEWWHPVWVKRWIEVAGCR